jgi:N-methylhydantoinase A
MSDSGRWWLGIDVGGTFTDVIAVNRESGEILDHKVLTTAEAQEVGVMQGIAETEIPIEEIGEIVHGHTAGINAILSRRGVRTGLLATSGHRDFLDIGRLDRQFGKTLYDPTWLRPHQARPMVRRHDRFGIVGRIGYDGAEIMPLDEDSVRDAARQIKAEGLESVGICFMNSYVDQSHERRAAEIVREECPDVYIQTSELYPVTKEHERTVTVAMDAYIGPIVTGYLHRLENALEDAGFAGSLWIMTMNGGVGTVAETSNAPVFQLVSGPVGGVSGAVDLVRRTDTHANLLTMDVGGTSTDVAVIRDGQTPMTDLWSVEHGLQMTAPVVDVTSVGSGAGSIIYRDAIGALRVGPESAGSEPGPASYGRGGERPTVTDACVLLGILQPDLFAGGALTLDKNLAEKALKSVADEFGMSPMELADGAYQLACSDMAGSIRSISTYRGLDLRDFALLPFGAAGPMMAGQVARELGLDSVVVPAKPGEFSAYGLLASDLRVTKARAPMKILGEYDPEDLSAEYLRIEEETTEDLARQGIDASDVSFERAYFAMYAGQTWDNRLPVPEGEIDADMIGAMHDQVHAYYVSRYGFKAEELPLLVTSIEVTAVAARPDLPAGPSLAVAGEEILRRVDLRLRGSQFEDVPVIARERLPVDDPIQGPVIIVEDYATTVVDQDSQAQADAHGNIVLTLS